MSKISCPKHYLSLICLGLWTGVCASDWGVKTFAERGDLEKILAQKLKPDGQYSLAQNSTGAIVLLHDGIQTQVLDSAACQRLKDYDPQLSFALDSASQSHSQSRSPAFFQQISKLDRRALGEWPTGLDVKAGVDLQTSRITASKGSWSMQWVAKVQPALWLGLGLEELSESGSFVATQKLKDSSQFSSWVWNFSVSLPWLRYELRQASTALPEFYYLEADAKEDLIQGQGSLLVLPKDPIALPADYGSNYVHSLEAKFGYAHVRYVADAENYSAAIWQYLLKDLPLGQSKWWMGLTQSKNRWAPGFGAEFFNGSLGSYGLGNQKLNPRLSLYINTWWRSPLNHSWSVGLQLRLPEFLGEFK